MSGKQVNPEAFKWYRLIVYAFLILYDAIDALAAYNVLFVPEKRYTNGKTRLLLLF